MSASYLRGCAQKRRHETREGAGGEKAALVAKTNESADKVSVYRCIQCGGWHVGHAANRFITRRRRSGKRPNKRLRGRV